MGSHCRRRAHYGDNRQKIAGYGAHYSSLRADFGHVLSRFHHGEPSLQRQENTEIHRGQTDHEKSHATIQHLTVQPKSCRAGRLGNGNGECVTWAQKQEYRRHHIGKPKSKNNHRVRFLEQGRPLAVKE